MAFKSNLNSLKHDYEKNLLKTQIEIQEHTFQNISREIHDNISLSLTLVKLNLNTLDWVHSEKAAESIKSSVHILGSAIADLSNLSKSMNTELIMNLGLMKVIRNEVEKLKNMARLNIDYEIKGEPIFMDSEKELIIFRIIQEAFNNILKHSKASKVWLLLDYSAHFLDVTIRDNGIGFVKEEVFNQKESNKAGLNNILNRAKLFNGTVNLETKPEKGTQILLTVPYH